MENRVKLTLMGISYNPMQDGAFGLLLAAEGSNKRIPIIIGAAEAQAIAIVIENINPQRPMTHDLFATLAHAFGVELKEVFIYNFEDGIFSAEMTFSDGDRQVTLDSRTSDAVAIAIRTGAPIYTTPAILEETGIELVESDSSNTDTNGDEEADDATPGNMTEASDAGTADVSAPDYEAMTSDELNDEFNAAMDADDFETAAVIRRILDSRDSDLSE